MGQGAGLVGRGYEINKINTMAALLRRLPALAPDPAPRPGSSYKPARLWLPLACALLPAALAPGAALAQASAVNPAPTIDRDRVDRQTPALPAAPRVAQPPAARPAVIEQAPAAAAQALRLSRVRYIGSTLPRATLDAATAPYIGQALTQENLQKIANAISATYTKSQISFFSVTVPRQSIVDGELAVQILEGRIAQYTLRQETASTPTHLIAAQMDRLMRDRPTHKSQLERTLSLLRDIPGQTVDAQLRTTAKPDELLLDLGVKRQQVEVSLNVNNNGVTNVVSGVQAQVAIQVNGGLREGDSTRVAAYLPFQPDRYQFYSLSHTTPLGANGTTLGLSGAHVRTRTRGTDIRGTATQAGIAVSHPLIRSYQKNLSLGVSLDGINSNNYFLDTAFGGFRTRVLRGSGNWSSVGKKGGYAISGSVSQGLDALGARAFEGYSEKSFTKANLQAVAVSELSKSTAIKLTARGQYSNDRLPTTERFALGGEGAGMAFLIGDLTAERALAGSVEVSWKVPRVIPGPTDKNGLTVFAYADGAVARSLARQRFAIPQQDFSLASAGGGVRLSVGGWSASAQVAVPVKVPNRFVERKTRFFFGISRAV